MGDQEAESEPSFVIHDDDPNHIQWGESYPEYPDYYKSVILDGTEYKVIVVSRRGNHY